MNNNLEESIYWVLLQVKEELLVSLGDGQNVSFDLEEGINRPDKQSQEKALKFLCKNKAIIIDPYYSKGLFVNQGPLIAMAGGKPIGYKIKILNPKFDELCKEYSNYKPKTDISQFTLTMYHNRANFYIDDERKIKFRNLSRPYVLETLYKAKGKEVSSEKIRSMLETKVSSKAASQKVSTIVNEIRNSIKKHFEIDPKIIIPDGVSGSGYKIGEIVINITKG